LLDKVRSKESNISPMYIHDYLDQYGASGYVTVKTGAWNTGWHHGEGFLQWTGSQTQKDGLARVQAVSDALHALFVKAGPAPESETARNDLHEAHWRLLRAETSCNFFWGEAWVNRAHEDLDVVVAKIAAIEQALKTTKPA
jgi:hypothetical protein